jgi:hypothetical protein
MVDKFWCNNVNCLSCNKLKTKISAFKNTTQNLLQITALFLQEASADPNFG